MVENKPISSERIDDYIIDKSCSFGEGAFGIVVKAYHVDKPDEIMACKIMNKKNLSADSHALL